MSNASVPAPNSLPESARERVGTALWSLHLGHVQCQCAGPQTACLRAQESVLGQGSCVCEHMDPIWALVMAMLHDAVVVC